MKIFSYPLFVGFTALFQLTPTEKAVEALSCEMVVTYAELAFGSFKKAYTASTMENAMDLIKNGVDKAEQASAYAVNPACDCQVAENYALNAVTFGNKALKAKTQEDQKKWVKKAMDMALDAVVGVNSCKE